MRHNFETAFAQVIGSEGGYQADPHDRGNWTTGTIGKGELRGTNYGVSAMSYPTVNIKGLTLAGAQAIYKRDYWDACRCDELPSGLDFVVFDCAVNQGPKDARIYLQRAVGATPDGAIGPKTLAAAKAADLREAIDELCVLRGLDYAALGTFSRYGKGWLRRLFDGHGIALELSGVGA